jgi:hypothetical protein
MTNEGLRGHLIEELHRTSEKLLIANRELSDERCRKWAALEVLRAGYTGPCVVMPCAVARAAIDALEGEAPSR